MPGCAFARVRAWWGQVDMELHEFGSELFDVRWANLGVLHKSGFDFC